MRDCPYGPAWVDIAVNSDDAHREVRDVQIWDVVIFSNMGRCDLVGVFATMDSLVLLVNVEMLSDLGVERALVFRGTIRVAISRMSSLQRFEEILRGTSGIVNAYLDAFVMMDMISTTVA